MQASPNKLLRPSAQLCQSKSPRGSKQKQQLGFLPRSAFQCAQGKSRVVTKQRVSRSERGNNPFAKEVQPVQRSPGSAPSAPISKNPASAPDNISSETDGKEQAEADKGSCTCPEVSSSVVDLSLQIDSVQHDQPWETPRRHIARLPTRDLIMQVDERNNTITELLRMGEATISASAFVASPLTTSSTESEEGESPNKKLSWEVLDIAADGVIRSLGERLNAITELSSASQSPDGEDECDFELMSNWSGRGSNDSQGTTIWNGPDASDPKEDTVEVKTLDHMHDDQLSVKKRCIVGHELKPHRTPSDRWWCSKCLKQVSEGTRLFGCRICNYDECWSCLSAAGIEVGLRCEPCLNDVTCTYPQKVLVQEVALLQEQMSVLQDQLREVTQERNAEVTKNRKLQDHISRMWKDTLSYSDFNHLRESACIE